MRGFIYVYFVIYIIGTRDKRSWMSIISYVFIIVTLKCNKINYYYNR